MADDQAKAFTGADSIVLKIWGQADMVLFIFAGAAAEFAVNKKVDWLYFTGKLPKDPIGRMFSTVSYAHKILFMDEAQAAAVIETINTIHKNVEHARGAAIPEWAYKDVLYLLIHYSIAAFEMLERKMTLAEKESVLRVFRKIGAQMHIEDLPESYADWLAARRSHLSTNLESSIFSSDLFLQYKRNLRPLRYNIMLQVQARLVPPRVQQLLLLKPRKGFALVLTAYKMLRTLRLQYILIPLLMPKAYAAKVRALNVRL